MIYIHISWCRTSFAWQNWLSEKIQCNCAHAKYQHFYFTWYSLQTDILPSIPHINMYHKVWWYEDICCHILSRTQFMQHFDFFKTWYHRTKLLGHVLRTCETFLLKYYQTSLTIEGMTRHSSIQRFFSLFFRNFSLAISLIVVSRGIIKIQFWVNWVITHSEPFPYYVQHFQKVSCLHSRYSSVRIVPSHHDRNLNLSKECILLKDWFQYVLQQ